MTIKFRIHQTQRDSDQQNRRFHKIMYTAALRLGIIPKIWNGYIEIQFDGFVTDEVRAHEANEALKGTLFINDQSFDDVILIHHPNATGRSSLVTFWPVSQHEDAKNSYTDPLVDTAMDGTPYDIELVATVMHEKFQENAGVSPATLMKILYEQENQALRDGALRIGELLEESLQREKETISIAESAKQAANEEKEKNIILVNKNDILGNENEQLRKALESIRERSKIGDDKDALHEVARAVTRPWPSKIPGSLYMNIGIEATIVDVYKNGSNISLTYIDKSGNNQTVTDFGYQGFVQLVFDYLMSCKVANQRAVFILTYKPDMRMRLAADTMMLGTYVNLWRNK
jgi:hypothetical protein